MSLKPWCLLPLVLCSFAAIAKPTEAEKARKMVEKKLDQFEKNYDPTKDLSRKNPEKLEKDIAELDAVLEELKGVDAAGASELGGRRETLVSKAKEGVLSAATGKNEEVFMKHFTKQQDQFDPETRRLENVDDATIKRAKDELDRDLAKFDPAARKPYEEKRDALFAKLKEDMARARLSKSRAEVSTNVPDLKPTPGAALHAPMSPTWCDGVAKALEGTYANYHVASLEPGVETPGPRPLISAVTFSCVDPDFEVRQKWVAWFRQGLANRYGFDVAGTERLMKLAAKLAIMGDLEKQHSDTCAQFAFLKTGTAEARYSRKLERMGLNCPSPSGEDRDELPMNAIDVPNGLSSQLAGAALARKLTTSGFHTDDGKLTGFAVASAVVKFDPVAFEQELTALKLNEAATINALENFYGVARDMKSLEAEARARNAAVLIDAPRKGAQAFMASIATTQPAIEMALTLEEAKRSGGSLKGCGEKLYAEVATAVKGEKTLVEDLRLDGLLSYKLLLCGLNDPDAPVMYRVFGYFADRSVPVRGPFTAAYLSLLDAHNATGGARGDRGNFEAAGKRGGAVTADKGPFVPDSNPIEPPEPAHNNVMNPTRLAAGVVKSIEKQGALTKMTFRTEKYMVPILACQETNKIDRIASDGTILYRSICKKTGEREAESTNEPITVPTWASAGVSAGNFLYYESAPVNDDVQGQPHRGWVVESWDSKARTKRTSLFGIAP